VLDRSLSPAACYCERQHGQREGRGVPDIGADEISFLIETQWLAEGDAAYWRAVGCAIARAVTRN